MCCATIYAHDTPLSMLGYLCAESVSDLHGGVKTGTIFTEAARITAIYDTQKGFGLKGGEFALGVLAIGQTHRQSLYTPAFQTPSGYSGVPEIKFTDLAYQQRLNNFVLLKAGIMDFDDYFNVMEVATPLLNSAFTNTKTMDNNTQLATYPFPGFGAFTKLGTNDLFLLTGIYQGNPQHQGTVFKNGQLILAELDSFFTIQEVDNIFKIAYWDYHQPYDYVATIDDYGVYGIYQITWQALARKMSFAINLGLNPAKEDTIYTSFATCLIINGIFKIRPNDSFNLGLGRVLLESGPHPETFYEAGYTIDLYRNFSITTDFQFYTHPGTEFKNAWVFIFHLNYNLPNKWPIS